MLIPDRRFRPEPMAAREILAWLETHDYVWYQAPGDYAVRRVLLNSKVKLWKRDPERFEVSAQWYGDVAQGGQRNTRTSVFKLTNEHLGCLRMPFPLWHHGITATLTHIQYQGWDKRAIVLNQSNGFHLEMTGLKHAIAHARHSAMELTVTAWFHGKKRTRVLVPAREPISGERTF